MSESPPRILIVEDDAPSAEGLRDLLEHMGYRVPLLAHTGDQALAAAEQSPPDLVLLDVDLGGGMSGIDVAHHLRQRHRVPVVYLTGNGSDRVVDQAADTEPHGFLVKPVSRAALRSTIEVALRKAQVEAQNARLVAELQEALRNVRTLAGLLPICCGCKRIRDDAGYWQEVEMYVARHTHAEFTHGFCPDCVGHLYPEYRPRDRERTG
jgi:CheY-like chemotaxis protein